MPGIANAAVSIVENEEETRRLYADVLSSLQLCILEAGNPYEAFDLHAIIGAMLSHFAVCATIMKIFLAIALVGVLSCTSAYAETVIPFSGSFSSRDRVPLR
jgi:hypothetical protein